MYFGMVATQIVAEMSARDAERKIVTSNIKALAIIVFGGLSNASEIADVAPPSFEFAYELTQEILSDEVALQQDIYDCWAESKPGKKLLDSLPKGIVMEEDKKKGKPKLAKIGTK